MLNTAILRIEDLASDYLARKSALSSSWLSRTEQRQQLERICRARPSLFHKAVKALEPALWLSIVVRAEVKS
jgi:hypothetical protein